MELMKSSDLAIVPASTTSIELAFLGVPMLLGYYVNNQKQIYEGFTDGKISKSVVSLPIGDFNKFDFSIINEKIQKLFSNNKAPLSINPQTNIRKEFFRLATTARKVSKGDVDFIFKLSNEKSVRLNSFNTDEIIYENHVNWFAKQLSSDYLFYIIEYNSKRAGQIRLSIAEQNSVIGISISEKFRGKGLAFFGLEIVVNEYFKKNKNPILAYIKKTNKASIKSFQKVGFIFYKEEVVNGNDSFVYIKGNNENR
jgi:RimJ/RimL family protein N-acetyltransferase